MQQSFIALALLAATLLVAGFFAYVYTIKRQDYLLLWTAGWALLGIHDLGPALSQWWPPTPLQSAMDEWSFALAGLFFFLGAQLYAQRKPWIAPSAITAVALGLWAAAHAANLIPISAAIPSALLLVAAGMIFAQESRRQETLADRLLAMAF